MIQRCSQGHLCELLQVSVEKQDMDTVSQTKLDLDRSTKFLVSNVVAAAVNASRTFAHFNEDFANSASQSTSTPSIPVHRRILVMTLEPRGLNMKLHEEVT